MLWQWAWNEWSQTSPTWRSRWYLRTLCIGTTSRSLSVNFPLLALFEHSWNKHNTHIYNSRSYNASYKGITYMSVFVVTETFSQGSINQSKASKECVVFLIYYCRIKIITRGRYETWYGMCIWGFVYSIWGLLMAVPPPALDEHPLSLCKWGLKQQWRSPPDCSKSHKWAVCNSEENKKDSSAIEEALFGEKDSKCV